MSKLRVMLVDDHAVLRDGLTALINAQSDMLVVGQADDGRAALQRANECQPDVVVLDVAMPGMSGAQATALLREARPDIAVVALTRHSEQGYVRQLLEAGARGYVLKQAAADELLAAIRAVALGDTYLDTTLTHRAVNTFVQQQRGVEGGEQPALSEREADVVRLIAQGYSNKEIAVQLGLSVKTVDTYKLRAMEKLGLHGRVALVRYALQQGWLD